MAPAAVVTSPAAVLTLEAEQRRLRALLDQAPAPFVILSADGVLRAVNKAARAMFATDDRILSPPPGLRDIVGRRASGERAVLSMPPRPGADTQRSYAVSVATSAATEGVSRLAVLTDVQAEMQAAEARVLRDLLQVLGHEIMNSLTPVTSLAESAHALLAGGDTADLPRVADALETIRRRARGLDRFVQGYRTLARLPPPVLRPTSVAGVLRDAAALFETRWGPRGVALTLDAPDPDVVARIDPDLIGQALLNLLTNAAEAAEAGRDRPPMVLLSGSVAHGHVTFRIIDSGDGVARGREDSIFQPFFSLKPDGTGIGLGLARQIASSHGGTLGLEGSQPGRGASFVMSI